VEAQELLSNMPTTLELRTAHFEGEGKKTNKTNFKLSLEKLTRKTAV
jgi:hypothetical protein